MKNPKQCVPGKALLRGPRPCPHDKTGTAWPVIIAIVMALGLGFLAGQLTAPGAGGAKKNDPREDERGMERPNDSGALGGRLERVLEMRAAEASGEGENGEGQDGEEQGSATLLAKLEKIRGSEADYLEKNVDLYVLSKSIGPEDWPGLFNSLLETYDDENSNHGSFYWTTFHLWARQDPLGLLRYAESIEIHSLKRNARYRAFSALAEDDFDAALRLANQEKDEDQQQSYLGIVIGQMAEENPHRALSTVMEMENQKMRESALNRAMAIWAREDLDAALEFAQTNLEGNERDEQVANILRNISYENAEKAWKVASELEETEDILNAKSSILYQLFNIDKEKAMAIATEALEGEISHRFRKTFISSIASSLSRKYPDEAWEWAQGLEAKERTYAQQRVIQQIAREDYQKALKLVENMPVGEDQINAYSQIAHNYAEADLEGSMSWALQLPLGKGRDNAVGSISREAAKYKPLETLEWLEQIGPNEFNHNSSQVIYQWAKSDREQAAQYVLQTPNDGARENMMRSLLDSEDAWADGREAAAWLESLRDPELLKDHADTVAREWSETNPREAADWASSLPEDQGRQNAVNAIVNQWTSRDPNGTGEWLNSLPAGEMRDQAVATFSRNLVRYDPLLAIDWAATISSDENTRNQALSSVARSWQSSDPDSANEWITRSNLPKETKESLLSD